MKTKFICSALLTIGMSGFGAPAEKLRVFVTETTAPQGTGDAAVGDAKGSFTLAGGTSPQNIEVMNAFVRYCPAVVVTGNREKADYFVELDHDPINPTTPFVHGNKVAVFDKNEDLIYSKSTRTLGSAVKGACGVMNGDARSSR